MPSQVVESQIDDVVLDQMSLDVAKGLMEIHQVEADESGYPEPQVRLEVIGTEAVVTVASFLLVEPESVV